MTERLYYTEPRAKAFSARVVEHIRWNGHPAVILDRTLFYPTGGGQPHDTGSLNARLVVDVVEREDDGDVVHVLPDRLERDEVEGVLNWERRFDFMQQHTGQHVLSAVFLERFGANTVGFHLSDEHATLDLDQAPFSKGDLAAGEALANSVVFENRPVMARFVPDEEASLLRLRKPLTHTGPVRVVEVSGFDCSACGGTHVQATGEIGLIKITSSERRGAETRLEFSCGHRALADYAAKNAMVLDLAQEFTVGHWELTDSVRRLAKDLKEARRQLRLARDSILDAEAAVVWNEAEIVGGCRIVRGCFTGRAIDDLKHLAQRLIAHPQTVALLASEGEAGGKSYFTFARSDDLDVNMGLMVRQACQAVGGRGGGRPNFAQGGGPHGELVSQALDKALAAITASLSDQTPQPESSRR
jgi:alanyl-tRNA synthetase